MLVEIPISGIPHYIASTSYLFEVLRSYFIPELFSKSNANYKKQNKM